MEKIQSLLDNSFEMPVEGLVLGNNIQEELSDFIADFKFYTMISEEEFSNPNNYLFRLDVNNNLYVIFMTSNEPVFALKLADDWEFLCKTSDKIH